MLVISSMKALQAIQTLLRARQSFENGATEVFSDAKKQCKDQENGSRMDGLNSCLYRENTANILS